MKILIGIKVFNILHALMLLAVFSSSAKGQSSPTYIIEDTLLSQGFVVDHIFTRSTAILIPDGIEVKNEVCSFYLGNRTKIQEIEDSLLYAAGSLYFTKYQFFRMLLTLKDSNMGDSSGLIYRTQVDVDDYKELKLDTSFTIDSSYKLEVYGCDLRLVKYSIPTWIIKGSGMLNESIIVESDKGFISIVVPL